jgi:hypothetical protein
LATSWSDKLAISVSDGVAVRRCFAFDVDAVVNERFDADDVDDADACVWSEDIVDRSELCQRQKKAKIQHQIE